MQKLVIFDLDGCLVESKDLHFHSLNSALEKINKNLCISYEEHLAIYDGLNTTRKLELLGITKGLEKKYYQQIWEDKQIATFELIKKFDVDEKLIRSEEHTSELQSH